MTATKTTIADLVEQVVVLAQAAPEQKAVRSPMYDGQAPHVLGGRPNTMIAEALQLGAALEKSYHYNTSTTAELLQSMHYRWATDGDMRLVAWLDAVLAAEDAGNTRRDAIRQAGPVPR